MKQQPDPIDRHEFLVAQGWCEEFRDPDCLAVGGEDPRLLNSRGGPSPDGRRRYAGCRG